MQRRDGVVMRLTGLVVTRGAALCRLAHPFFVDETSHVETGRGKFERVQRKPSIAVGEIDQSVSGLIRDRQAAVAKPSLRVGQRPHEQDFDVGIAQCLEDDDTGAGQKGSVDFETKGSRWLRR